MEMFKRALDDCVINFDRRVLVTDLLQEYKLPYTEVNKVLSTYVAEQEKKGTKFEKRFLVSGDEEETNNEVYTVVQGESKLQEWLRKLKNAESALYSIEIAGGAKAAAEIFKPMTWCAATVDAVETRPPLKFVSVNGTSNGDIKPNPKVEAKKNGFDFGIKKPTTQQSDSHKTSTVEKNNIKPSPEVKKEESSPENHKSATTKPINKKGIASFFGPSSSIVKSESKKSTGVVKPPTPKKMEDFFKKPDKSTKTITTSKDDKEEKSDTAANISMPLFGNDDDETMESDNDPHTVVEVDTSDDEEQLETLRKQCREKEEKDTSNSGSNKRRRIIDSDDEEPEIKHEKKNENEGKNSDDDSTEAGKSETFLDEDGFVITIKSKKPITNKKPVQHTSPKKSPPKQETTMKSTKSTSKQVAKTKQGNIMSFFSKK